MISFKSDWQLELTTERILLLAILTGAALLDFWDLDRTSLWLDEAASLHQSHRGFLDMLAHTAGDNYPPLHNIILWTTIKLFGLSETAVRFPSAVMAVMAVYAIYRLGRCAWNGTEGLIAAMLLALLPIHIWHASEARMYSLLSLISIGFLWATVAHFKYSTRRSAMIAGGAGFLLLMSHIYGSFVFASVNVFIVLAFWRNHARHDDRFRSWLKWQVVATLGFVPWIVLLAGRANHVVTGGFWIPYPGIGYLQNQMVKLFSLPLIWAGAALLGAVIAQRLWQNYRRAPSDQQHDLPGNPVWLFTVWLLAPFAIGYTISILTVPILHSKYLIGCLPAAPLLIAHAIGTLPVPAMLRATIPLLIAALMLPQSMERATVSINERHDMRAAVAAINTKSEPGDQFQLHPWYFRSLFAYYKTHDPDGWSSTKPWKDNLPFPPGGRVWLIVADDGRAEEAAMLNSYRALGYRLETSRRFNRLTVHELDSRPLQP